VVQGVQANVGALINDTVGVLAAVRYLDGTDTIASVIMGTGKPALSPFHSACEALGFMQREAGL